MQELARWGLSLRSDLTVDTHIDWIAFGIWPNCLRARYCLLEMRDVVINEVLFFFIVGLELDISVWIGRTEGLIERGWTGREKILCRNKVECGGIVGG